MNRQEIKDKLTDIRDHISSMCCGTIMDKDETVACLDMVIAGVVPEYSRRVVCAANRYPDGTIVPSARHHDPLMNKLIKALGLSGQEAEQGFIDQYRQFMTREEAWVVANAAGQIIRRCGGDDDCLYSENIC